MRGLPIYVLLLAGLASSQGIITITRTVVPTTTVVDTASPSTSSSNGASSSLTADGSSPTVSSTTTSPTRNSATSSTSAITAVSDCHMHSTIQFCVAGTAEFQVKTTPTAGQTLPTAYSGCHSHGTELFCISPAGKEVEMVPEALEATASSTSSEGSAGVSCHEHFGVQHCVGAGSEAEGSCERVEREYNIPLRVGILFVILITSAIGVFAPIFLTAFTKLNTQNMIFTLLKQFGTGIIISTAFVHLYTHAALMFGNSCLGQLSYESTTSAVFMAGLFLAFFADYIGARVVLWRSGKMSTADEDVEQSDKRLVGGTHASSDVVPANEALDRSATMNVVVLEAGIIFHSILIGITLVVSGDTFFLTLFAVILFHQMFEGIALGTRIAALPRSSISLLKKLIMGTAFALVTPVGMAIGIGALSHFNGNDPATIIAIGTLDAVSAGILAWIGIVEMWAADWIFGELKDAGMIRILCSLGALLLGLIIMSVLGKWA